MPLLTGMLADASGSLGLALALPAVCYLVIAMFGLYARRPCCEDSGFRASASLPARHLATTAEPGA